MNVNQQIKHIDKGEIYLQLKKNDIHQIEIIDLTHEAQGVAKINDYTLFVEDALPDEHVECKLLKLNKSYGFAKTINILKASPHRQEPFCPVFKRCGGCAFQHFKYEAQLDYKTRYVREVLKRIGGMNNVKVNNTLGMKEPYYYRNKVLTPVAKDKNGNAVAGFYAKRSHFVVDTDKCYIQDKTCDDIRNILRQFINDKKISIYDEEKSHGLLRHIMVRKGFKTGEVMVVLVINGDLLPFSDDLIDILKDNVDNFKSLVLNINKKKTNVALGEKNIILFGNPYIRDYIGDFIFNISPISFFQVNPVQTEILYTKALEFCKLTGNETVFDLYCGTGTISLFLSKHASKVYGVEVVEQAVQDAKNNAALNNVNNVEFLKGEAETIVPALYEKGIAADVVVVDPPRKGCEVSLLESIAKMTPKRIVYVSCNPATLARDLKFLKGEGYEVVEVQPVDMFPWTGHIETVAVMSKANL